MSSDHPLDAELQTLRERRLQALKDRANAPVQPAAPIKITDATFAEIVEKTPYLVVDVWAPWCGPCRMLEPVLEHMAAEHEDRVVIAKLNADENPGVTTGFQVSGIPTLLIFREGKLVDRIVGVLPRPQLEARLGLK